MDEKTVKADFEKTISSYESCLFQSEEDNEMEIFTMDKLTPKIIDTEYAWNICFLRNPNNDSVVVVYTEEIVKYKESAYRVRFAIGNHLSVYKDFVHPLTRDNISFMIPYIKFKMEMKELFPTLKKADVEEKRKEMLDLWFSNPEVYHQNAKYFIDIETLDSAGYVFKLVKNKDETEKNYNTRYITTYNSLVENGTMIIRLSTKHKSCKNADVYSITLRESDGRSYNYRYCHYYGVGVYDVGNSRFFNTSFKEFQNELRMLGYLQTPHSTCVLESIYDLMNTHNINVNNIWRNTD